MSLIDYLKKKVSELTNQSEENTAGSGTEQLNITPSSYGDTTQMSVAPNVSYAEPNMSYASPEQLAQLYPTVDFGDPTQMTPYTPPEQNISFATPEQLAQLYPTTPLEFGDPTQMSVQQPIYGDTKQMSVQQPYTPFQPTYGDVSQMTPITPVEQTQPLRPVAVQPMQDFGVTQNDVTRTEITLPKTLPSVGSEQLPSYMQGLDASTEPTAFANFIKDAGIETANAAKAGYESFTKDLGSSEDVGFLDILGNQALGTVQMLASPLIGLVKAGANKEDERVQEQYKDTGLKQYTDSLLESNKKRSDERFNKIREGFKEGISPEQGKELTRYILNDGLQEYVNETKKSVFMAKNDNNNFVVQGLEADTNTMESNKRKFEDTLDSKIKDGLTQTEALKATYKELGINTEDELALNKFYFKGAKSDFVNFMVEGGYQPDDILKAMQTKAVQMQDSPWYMEVLSNVNSIIGANANLAGAKVSSYTAGLTTNDDIDALARASSMMKSSYSIPEGDKNAFWKSARGALPETLGTIFTMYAGNKAGQAVEGLTAIDKINKGSKTLQVLGKLAKSGIASIPEELVINAQFNNTAKQYGFDDLGLDFGGLILDIGLRSSPYTSAVNKMVKLSQNYQGALDEAIRGSIIKDESIAISKAENITQEEAYKKAVENYGARENEINNSIQQQVAQGVDPKVAEDTARNQIGNQRSYLNAEEVNGLENISKAWEARVSDKIIEGGLDKSPEFNTFLKSQYMSHRVDSVFGKAYEGLDDAAKKEVRDNFIETRVKALQLISQDPTKTIADLVGADIGEPVDFFLGIAKGGTVKGGKTITGIGDIIGNEKGAPVNMYKTIEDTKDTTTSKFYLDIPSSTDLGSISSRSSRLANSVDTGINAQKVSVEDFLTQSYPDGEIFVDSISGLEDFINGLKQKDKTAIKKKIQGKTIIGGDRKVTNAYTDKGDNDKRYIGFDKTKGGSEARFGRKEKNIAILDDGRIVVGHSTAKAADDTAKEAGLTRIDTMQQQADIAFKELSKARYGADANAVDEAISQYAQQLGANITLEEARQVMERVAKEIYSTSLVTVDFSKERGNMSDDLKELTKQAKEIADQYGLQNPKIPQDKDSLKKAIFVHNFPRTAEAKAQAKAYLLQSTSTVDNATLTEAMAKGKFNIPETFARDFLGGSKDKALNELLLRNPELGDIIKAEEAVQKVVDSLPKADISKFDYPLNLGKGKVDIGLSFKEVSPTVKVMLVKADGNPVGITEGIAKARENLKQFIDEYTKATEGVTDEKVLYDMKKKAQIFVDLFENQTLRGIFGDNVMEAANKSQYGNIVKSGDGDRDFFIQRLKEVEAEYNKVFNNVQMQLLGKKTKSTVEQFKKAQAKIAKVEQEITDLTGVRGKSKDLKAKKKELKTLQKDLEKKFPEDKRPIYQKVIEDGFAINMVDGNAVVVTPDDYLKELIAKLPDEVNVKVLGDDFLKLNTFDKNQAIKALEYINNMIVKKQGAYQSIIEKMPDMKYFFNTWTKGANDLPKAFDGVPDEYIASMQMARDDISKIALQKEISIEEINKIVDKHFTTADDATKDAFKKKFEGFSKLHAINPEYLKAVEEASKDLPSLEKLSQSIVDEARYNIGGKSVPIGGDSGITLVKAPDATDGPQIFSDVKVYDFGESGDFGRVWSDSIAKGYMDIQDTLMKDAKGIRSKYFETTRDILNREGKYGLVQALDNLDKFESITKNLDAGKLFSVLGDSKFSKVDFSNKFKEYFLRVNEFNKELKDIDFIAKDADDVSRTAAMFVKAYKDLLDVAPNVSETFAKLVDNSLKDFQDTLKNSSTDQDFLRIMKAKTAALENNTLLDFLGFHNKTIELSNGKKVKIGDLTKIDKQQIDILNDILGTNLKNKSEYKEVLSGLSEIEIPFNTIVGKYLSNFISPINKYLGNTGLLKYFNVAKVLTSLSPMAILGSGVSYGSNAYKFFKSGHTSLTDGFNIMNKYAIGKNVGQDISEIGVGLWNKAMGNDPQTWYEMASKGQTFLGLLGKLREDILGNPQNFVDYALAPIVKNNVFTDILKSGELGMVFKSGKEFDELLSRMSPELRDTYLQRARSSFNYKYGLESASVAQNFNRYKPTSDAGRIYSMMHTYRQMRAVQAATNTANNVSDLINITRMVATGKTDIAQKIARNNPFFANFFANVFTMSYLAVKAKKAYKQYDTEEESMAESIKDIFDTVLDFNINWTGMNMAAQVKTMKNLGDYISSSRDTEGLNKQAKELGVENGTFDSSPLGYAIGLGMVSSLARYTMQNVILDDLMNVVARSDGTQQGIIDNVTEWLYRSATAGDRWLTDESLAEFNSYYSSSELRKNAGALLGRTSGERGFDTNQSRIAGILNMMEKSGVITYKNEQDQEKSTTDLLKFLGGNFQLYNLMDDVLGGKKQISTETKDQLRKGIYGHPLAKEYLDKGEVDFTKQSLQTIKLAKEKFVGDIIDKGKYISRKADGSGGILANWKAGDIYDEAFNRVLDKIGEDRLTELQSSIERKIPGENAEENQFRGIKTLVDEINTLKGDDRIGSESVMLAYSYMLEENSLKDAYEKSIAAKNKLVKGKGDDMSTSVNASVQEDIDKQLMAKYGNKFMNTSRDNSESFLVQDFINSNPEIAKLSNVMVESDKGYTNLNYTAKTYVTSYMRMIEGLNEGKSFAEVNSIYKGFKGLTGASKILLALQTGNHIDNRTDISKESKQNFKEEMLTEYAKDMKYIEDYRKVFGDEFTDDAIAYFYGTANDGYKMFNEEYNDYTVGNSSGKSKKGKGAGSVGKMKVEPLKFTKPKSGNNPFAVSNDSGITGTRKETNGKFLDFDGEKFTSKKVSIPGGFKSLIPFPLDSGTAKAKEIKRSVKLKNRFKLSKEDKAA